MLGKAKFKDFAAFSEWYVKNGYDWGNKRWSNVFYHLQKEVEDIYKLYKSQFETHFWRDDTEEKRQQKKEKYCMETLKNIKKIVNYMDTYNASWDLRYLSENNECAVIAFGESKFIIPEPDKWLEINLFKDYNGLNVSELKQLHGASDGVSLIPKNAISNISVNSVKDNISDKQSEINELEQRMQDIKDAKTPELAKLQAEIDEKIASLEAKKQEMVSVLQEKREEMDVMVKKLETQLFVLQSEIYGIRCFLGEVIEFTQLTRGIPEKEDTPVVLFQKVRYLDEELGKMASIYDVEWSDHELFEQLISNVPAALETFCPNTKCISLVRLSKSGSRLAAHDLFNNMLKHYQLYHGTKIGILLRNGENLYIGWTDDDYINIREDMFYKPEVKTIDEGQSGGQSTKEEVASRYFVFSILQGLLENKKLITLPGKQSFMQPSKYIVFSAAENWLADNRYGPFDELIKKCNSIISKGDTILTVESLRPDTSERYIRNDRGRGYANRTHDVLALDCELYKINLIEEEQHRYAVFLDDKTSTCRYTSSLYGENPEIPKPHDGYHFSEIQTESIMHYFISLHKRWSLSGTARANFEVYKDEFINLTFMNSLWLYNAIVTKNLGEWRIGGCYVDYAHGIKYLKTALDFVKKREVSEKELIEHYYDDLDSVPEWQIKLSEWKLTHNVHTITDYQAKRFAKTLKKEVN